MTKPESCRLGLLAGDVLEVLCTFLVDPEPEYATDQAGVLACCSLLLLRH